MTCPVLSGDNDQVAAMCVGLVKLDDERFVYMADDCDSEHNFVCDASKHISRIPCQYYLWYIWEFCLHILEYLVNTVVRASELYLS